MASSTEWNEQTIRRREGSGEKEFRGATDSISLRMVASEAGWKRTISWRSVIRRVFDGGLGWERGGRLERSRVSAGRDEEEEDREARLAMNEGEEGMDCGGDAVIPSMLCVF